MQKGHGIAGGVMPQRPRLQRWYLHRHHHQLMQMQMSPMTTTTHHWYLKPRRMEDSAKALMVVGCDTVKKRVHMTNGYHTKRQVTMTFGRRQTSGSRCDYCTTKMIVW